MTAPERLLVSLCTYDERENLGTLIPVIWEYAPAADVLVIDDNSPDGTGLLADEWAARDNRVRVLHRPAKLGLGSAILTALRFALDNKYTLLVNLDADFSHHPRFIPDLLALTETCDVAIGSRYVRGGKIVGWGWLRHVMSRCINFYARMLLGLSTRDCSGAFRCYRLGKLRGLDLDRFLARGFAFQQEMLYRCRCIGCRLGETPIVFEDRRAGNSKISMSESVTAAWVILRLALSRGVA
jgi:dolichol-phosphate mannosyltransferase